jgi:beta-lactam-binding protein with PASTA domain
MAWARGAAAVAVALTVLVSGAWLLGYAPTLDPVDALAGKGEIVEVPDLSGLARPRAVADVRSARLTPRVTTAFSLSAPRGAVISQDPAAGTKVREGHTVVVVVSRGVTRVDMPDAVGKPLAEVVGPLDDAGVAYAVEQVSSEVVPKGVVISQTPEPGGKVIASDTVRFVVSAGPDPRPVPAVAGLSREGAAFALGRAGFVVGEVTNRDDANQPVGAVVGTDPAAGTVQPKDTPVKVAVSDGPPPVPVPSLVNLAADQAVAQLESVGLVANVSGWMPTGGKVVTQQPVAGTPLRPGSLVAVGVGSG